MRGLEAAGRCRSNCTAVSCCSAAGDLAQQININRRDSIGHLAQALNRLNVNLQSIVGVARSEVTQIDETISEIANGNNDMSTRIESRRPAACRRPPPQRNS